MNQHNFIEQLLAKPAFLKQRDAQTALSKLTQKANFTLEIEQKTNPQSLPPGIHLYHPFKKEIVFLEEVDICLVVEGTYPYVKGGVSTVVHQVIQSLPQFKFGILHCAWNEESHKTPLYPELPQIKWVHPYLLGSPLANHPADKMSEVFKKNGLPKQKKFFKLPSKWKRLISFRTKMKLRDFLFSICRVFSTPPSIDPKEFLNFYHKYLNPLTSKLKTYRLVNHPDFFHYLQRLPDFQKMTLEDLYWVRHEFTPVFQNLFFGLYPVAKCYHSHTTGYGGFVATLAGIQHHNPMLITEHSLYLADVRQQLEEQEKIHLKKLKDKFISTKTFENGSEELEESDLLKPNENIKLDRFYHLKNYTIQKKYKLWAQWFAWMSQLTYARAEKISYLYMGLAQKAQQFSAPAARQVIIPNGIDESVFGKVLIQRLTQKTASVGKPKPFTLGLIGRIVPVKGILDFIQSIALLRDLSPIPFEAWIIGGAGEDKHYAQSCIDLVQKLKLDSHIKFCGERNMTEVLLSIDLIVLSSLSEALPMVILEGMASGIAVVSTQVGCVVDMLEKELKTNSGQTIGAAGITVARQNPELLAKAIAELMADPVKLKEFEANGPLRVKEQYTFEKMRQAYLNFYQGALSQHKEEIKASL